MSVYSETAQAAAVRAWINTLTVTGVHPAGNNLLCFRSCGLTTGVRKGCILFTSQPSLLKKLDPDLVTHHGPGYIAELRHAQLTMLSIKRYKKQVA
jgi:hypothetical protein